MQEQRQAIAINRSQCLPAHSSVCNQSNLSWWVEISTSVPHRTYYFSPFDSQSVLAAIKNQLIAGIEDLRAVTPTQRTSKVKEFCGEPQWKLEGLTSKVKLKSMQSLEVAS